MGMQVLRIKCIATYYIPTLCAVSSIAWNNWCQIPLKLRQYLKLLVSPWVSVHPHCYEAELVAFMNMIEAIELTAHSVGM